MTTYRETIRALEAAINADPSDFAARGAWVDLMLEQHGERAILAGLRWLNAEGKWPAYVHEGFCVGWAWWLWDQDGHEMLGDSGVLNEDRDCSQGAMARLMRVHETPVAALLAAAKAWAQEQTLVTTE